MRFEDILFGMTVIAPYAVWGLSIGIVYLHASSSNRSTWFWMLVALFLPGIGVIIYFCYHYYKTSRMTGTIRARRLQRIGEYVAKPRTPKEKEDHEQIATLANYRDKEVEEDLIEGRMEDAIAKSEQRAEEALDKGDKTARETYGLYLSAAYQYRRTYDLPRVLRDLWGIEDEPDELDTCTEPAEGEPEPVTEEEHTDDDEEIIFDPDDDRNRWIEI